MFSSKVFDKFQQFGLKILLRILFLKEICLSFFPQRTERGQKFCVGVHTDEQLYFKGLGRVVEIMDRNGGRNLGAEIEHIEMMEGEPRIRAQVRFSS